MKIIILGAGQVGSTLVADLCQEKHDVTVVDRDPQKLQELQRRLDLLTITGSASYPEILRQAGAQDADMLIAVTESDEVNIVACLAAYALFSIPTKIARIHSPHYFVREKLFSEGHHPIDVFITPEQLISRSIQEIIQLPGALQVVSFANGEVKLIVTKAAVGGAFLGKSLSDLQTVLPGIDMRILAIFRNNQAITLKSSTHIEEDDELFFISATQSVPAIMAILHKPLAPYKRVMIVGGGRVGTSLAESLQENYQVKIIEQNRERCEILAKHLNTRSTILHGNADDQELLISENIQDIDVFCAMTNDDEDNIMSSLQAKRLGAKCTIALIKRRAYAEMIEGSGIDVVISPHQVMVGSILAHIRPEKMVSLYVLRGSGAEAIEMIAHSDKKANMDMPEGTIIGAILRDKAVIIPTEETVIAAGDHVILFSADKRHIRAIAKLFR